MSAYTTIPVASTETGVSQPLIADAIQRGEIRVWNCAGEAVVTLTDVRDFKARILSERGCKECN